MPVCLPAPAPLVNTTRRAVAFVSARVAAIPMPDVCLEPNAAAGSGLATVGYIGMSQADAAIFARPVATWPADRAFAVMHEALHQVAMNNGLQAGQQLNEEEGLSEAVAHDLKRQWFATIRHRDAAVGMAYPDRVARVRLASARATRTRWTSPAARRWRVEVIAMPPAQRPIIQMPGDPAQ